MFENFENVSKPELLNPLVLAYIGDAVYEVYVRTYISGDGAFKTNALHKKATTFVSARAQSTILDRISECLTEEELNIVRRGRNANSNTVPKNANIADYKKATAFEALIGYLFLNGKIERLEEIIKKVFENEKN